MPSTRRAVLRAGAAALAGVAGCLGTNGDESTDEPTTGFPPPMPTSAAPQDPRPLPTRTSWPTPGRTAARRGVLDGSAVPADPGVYWQFYTRLTAPVVADDRLLTVEDNREQRLVARDAATGRVRWQTPIGGEGARTPTVVGETAYLPRYTAVEAYDVTSGERRWHTGVGGGPVTHTAVVDGTVYAAQSAHQTPAALVALDTAGEKRWRVRLPGDEVGDVAVGGGDAFVGCDDGHLVAVGSGGEERWRVDLGGDASTTPAVAGGTVFCLAGSTLHARRASDGSERWTATISGDGPGDEGGVAVAGDVVAAGHAGGVTLRRRRDGSERWSVATDGPVTAPTMDDSRVYVGETVFRNRSVYAFDRAGGAEQWAIETGKRGVSDMVVGGVRSSPVLVAGGVYVAAADGLYAIGTSG